MSAYEPRHYGTAESVAARAVTDADRATLLLAQTDPHRLFPVLVAAGALPMDTSQAVAS